MENKNLARFLLTFFLGWIGSIIINHTELKPAGFTCRTGAYFFLPMITFGIYSMVIWSRIADELNIVACRYDGNI